MDVEKIEKLEELVSTHLSNDEEVTGHKITRLTAPGMNYGSLMLRVEIKVKNKKTNKERILDSAAKLIPPNDFIQSVFNTQVTFKNENWFYTDIFPALRNFKKQQGVGDDLDFAAKCYGARINLDKGSERVDENAILMLENLKTAGYEVLDRMAGFDFQTAKAILTAMAEFHATCLALKLQEPAVFETTIKPHLTNYLPHQGKYIQTFGETLEENKECRELKDPVLEILNRGPNKTPTEPWSAVMHNDMWINNFMVKRENGKVTGVKILDYQVCEYNSLARDVVFFLFSSISTSNLKQYLDKLIDFYYERFIYNMKQLKCDVNEFHRKAFDEEMKIAARESELFHLSFMYYAVYANAEKTKEISEFTREDFEEINEILLIHKEKIWFTALEFAKRGWI